MKLETKQEVIKYINKLTGYQGYVQFSDRRIEDVFETFSDIQVEAVDAFVYEAYFFNGTDSIMIKQINDAWYVDETHDIPLNEILTYHTVMNNLKVKMVHIWEEEADPLCAGMPVQKLKKVVFAGFEGGLS